MGLFSSFISIVSSAYSIGEARSVIREGLQEALDVMENMVGNAGQESVFNNYVQPQFRENSKASIRDGWDDVDIGEYMDFMGEIVEEGNQIMAYAYELADEILSELEEAAEEGFYE
tara:strand:+ start:2263 stop:2610 length:348 start_codon:yes stop_codon:yes gene_type:complete